MQRHLPWLLLTVGLLAAAVAALGQAPATAPTLKPYRVLVVVETWGDPASQVITEKDTFQPVAALLKAWSVPFDILRLDQQNLGAGYLFDRFGRARYGTVLWLADPASYAGKNLDILTEAVHGGTSVVFTVSRFADPALEHILGLKYKADYRAADPLVVGPAHFITRETPIQPSNDYGSHGIWVESRDAQVLIQQGQHPVVTVRQPSPNTAAVWIGAPNLRALRDSPYWRIFSSGHSCGAWDIWSCLTWITPNALW